MTSSVSVISSTPDNAVLAVSHVRGCPQMIADCWSAKPSRHTVKAWRTDVAVVAGMLPGHRSNDHSNPAAVWKSRSMGDSTESTTRLDEAHRLNRIAGFPSTCLLAGDQDVRGVRPRVLNGYSRPRPMTACWSTFGLVARAVLTDARPLADPSGTLGKTAW